MTFAAIGFIVGFVFAIVGVGLMLPDPEELADRLRSHAVPMTTAKLRARARALHPTNIPPIVANPEDDEHVRVIRGSKWPKP